jgi:hypothetical protein
MASDNARDAQARASDREGLYLLSWNGETLPARYARPGMLQTRGDDQPVRLARRLPAAALAAQAPSLRSTMRSNRWEGSSVRAASIARASRPTR